ncbi:hypothetical protein DPEC_G00069790 [Dallia pectoralis]|uniref:Uncharacterized protein n=1 Tax=Dallia pectoralis TaxID=75939 RepID=A0ACC2H221_DALPE|nr:hypothetical protein DPEC_G00069790 [Dallia pectoralis]
MRGIILLCLLGVLSAHWPPGSRQPFSGNVTMKPVETENHTSADTELKSTIEEYKCLKRMNSSPPYNESGLYCKRTWDGRRCWDDSPAGSLGWQYCPGYFRDFDEKAIATKNCTESGQWFVHPHSQKEWTNYTLCASTAPQTSPPFNHDDFQRVQTDKENR